MTALAQAGYRVVAPDQRGYNLTDKQPPYDIGTLVQDVVQLIRACGHEQARVAGHDWGAGVAWSLAATFPERVRQLAIINVPHPVVAARAWLGGNLRQMARSLYIGFFQIPRLPEWLLSRDNFALLRLGLTRSARPGTFSPVDLRHYEEAWRRPGALSGGLGWYRALWSAVRSGEVKKYARRIRVPTIILWGERDQALGVELAEASALWLDAGRLVRFPNASHWIVEESPDEVSRHLLEHFKT
jgi:pimeloyl-ACP methyl ester carboxylesterase